LESIGDTNGLFYAIEIDMVCFKLKIIHKQI
jgi:hypothetical protein